MFEVLWFALKVVLQMNIDTIKIGQEFFDMRRLIGSVGHTPLTHLIPFQLLDINARSGNVGQTLSLLNLKKSRNCPPSDRSFFMSLHTIPELASLLEN